ncbi:hypothetical protein GTQ45_01900 [Pyruvatibacter mobilis]|uniref:Uncharacterized protein n=1 Tax=Pyruvatibacter mobilis TaxID=1712261 RepID=A0A845Q7S3_9HYPH|nr:hypothetical protein [Pyruvatibacter mobilis]NBG94484.1 hypothetical protein [Pyruvatibacter mobilis]QJD74004.1 hypothetical protein HG718_00450 [Pyruvatibacter mobilis]GGD03301.1 hypothetical protein GCM10011587_03790 [Pyruvatibacter mobilis]
MTECCEKACACKQDIRVPIYDEKNPQRLLGYLVNPPETTHRTLKFALRPQVPPYNYLRDPIPHIGMSTYDPAMRIRIVEFCKHFSAPEGASWVCPVSVRTSATMEDLREVDCFRFPGEDEDEAEFRHLKV